MGFTEAIFFPLTLTVKTDFTLVPVKTPEDGSLHLTAQQNLDQIHKAFILPPSALLRTHAPTPLPASPSC